MWRTLSPTDSTASHPRRPSTSPVWGSAAFVDSPAGAAYRHGFDGQDRTTQLKISRSDLAGFLLGQRVHDACLRRAVSLSY